MKMKQQLFFALNSEKIITIFYVCFMAPIRSTLYSYSILRLRQYLRKIEAKKPKQKIRTECLQRKLSFVHFHYPLSPVHNCLRTPFALSFSSNRRNETIQLNSFIHRKLFGFEEWDLAQEVALMCVNFLLPSVVSHNVNERNLTDTTKEKESTVYTSHFLPCPSATSFSIFIFCGGLYEAIYIPVRRPRRRQTSALVRW